VRLESLLQAVDVPLGVELVLPEPVLQVDVVHRVDDRVEHAEDALLHRERLLEMLDQLVFELHHNLLFHGPQDEAAVLAAGQRGAAGETLGVGLELVDERQRPAVAEPAAFDVERHTDASDLRPPVRSGDALADACHRRKRAARAPDLPQPVEL
jgi:hypothetical protein